MISSLLKMSSPEEDNLSHVSESDVESCASEVIPMYHRPVRNQSGVKVLTSNNCDGRRVWDKHQYCVFCSKAFAKLPRHMESAHSGEREVAEALMYDKKSKERSKKWEILRNKGNHSHNVEVLKKGEGFIIPVKRPTKSVSASCYLPCKQCLGYYVAKDMWKHIKQCPLTEEKKRQSKHLQSECALLLPMAEGTSSAFKEKVLAKMINDDVSWLAKNDETILQLGQRIMGSVDDAVHLFQYVSQKMREVSRLLLVVRDLNPELQTIQDCIHPKYFDTVVQAVKLASGYDSGGNTYKTPSLALKLGHSIRKCAMIVKSKGIKTEDEDLQRRGKDFDDLCANDWAAAVSSRALSTLGKRKWNKSSMLPLSEDVTAIQKHLNEKADKLQQQLKVNPNVNDWAELTQVALAKVILFNRRRSGEIARMSIDDYQQRSKSHNPDVVDSLSKWEKKLCQSLMRVEIRGKRGRRVPVLLTQSIMEMIDILMKTRKEVGVSSSNTFLFPRPTALTSYRGSDCLRKYAHACGAQHPENLTSTQLRKQVATLSQILSLRGNELDVLAGFMGHDLNIHREYYRLPESTIQTAKVSKILLLAEKGSIGDFSHKSLDEIDIDLGEWQVLVIITFCTLFFQSQCVPYLVRGSLLP